MQTVSCLHVGLKIPDGNGGAKTPSETTAYQLTTEAALLRRKILIAVIGGGLLITLVACCVVVTALHARLQDAEKAELRQELLIRKLSLSQFAGRARAIAELVASRTRARQLLQGFLDGSVPKQEMSDGLTKILGDALASTKELIGVLRCDPKGQPVFQLGETLPVPELPPGFSRSEQTTIHGPFVMGKRRWLAVNTPIRDKEGNRYGTDIVFLHDEELVNLLRGSGNLSGLIDLTLGRRERDRIHLLRQTPVDRAPDYEQIADTQAGFMSQALLGEEGIRDDQVNGSGRSLLSGFAPVPGSPWGLLARVDRDEFYAGLNQRLLGVFGGVLVLMAVGALGLYRMMDPLAAGVVVHAESLENEVARQTAEISRKNKELSQVVYVASHDLRSPLVNAQGFSRELQAAFDDIERILQRPEVPEQIREQLRPAMIEDAPEALNYIHASIDKMDALLKGLLRISRLGRTKLNLEALDMNVMMGRIRDTFEAQLREEQAELRIGPTLPSVEGDALQINQVFSNLIGNALKYRDPDRAPLIEATGELRDGEAIFAVRDNGLGIAAEHQEKAFELYHRLNPRDSIGGEGLGLTIVRTILDRHAGRIWLESEAGVGSTFFVALPLAKETKTT